MPQPKAPRIDWLLEAWRLAELLPKVPSRRRSFDGIALPMGDIQDDDDSQDDDAIRHDDIIRHFDALLEKVNAQMNHAVGKATPTAVRKQMPRFEGTAIRGECGILATADAVLAKVGGTDSDLGVVDVGIAIHKMLSFARHRRYLTDDQRTKLPVIVAAMAGDSTALAARLRANAPRVRTNRLRAAMSDELRNKPGANWLTLLVGLRLAGIVKRHDDAVILWDDHQNVERTTATSTFQKWVALHKRNSSAG